MDALDQIGDMVIEAVKAYFGESHNRGVVERLTKQVTHPRCGKAEDEHRGCRQDRSVHGCAGEDDAEEAKAQAERLGAKQPVQFPGRRTMWLPVPAPARSWWTPRSSA